MEKKEKTGMQGIVQRKWKGLGDTGVKGEEEGVKMISRF